MQLRSFLIGLRKTGSLSKSLAGQQELKRLLYNLNRKELECSVELIRSLLLRLTRSLVLSIPKGKTVTANTALYLFGNTFQGTVKVGDGRRFFIKKIKPIHRELFFSGTFEKDITRIIQAIVKEGDYVFDLGANFGWYTTLLSRLVGSGKVFAFEMGGDIYEELNTNVNIGGYGNVVLEDLAIGDSEKDIPYFYFENAGVANLSPEALSQQKNTFTGSVRMTTLDSYINKNPIPRLDFIKCDIDGSEVLFLKGARKTINKYRPVVVIEAVDSAQQLFGFRAADILNELDDYRFFIIEQDLGEVSTLPENFNGNMLCIPSGKAGDILGKLIIGS